MGKKRQKARGRPFDKGSDDPRINRDGRPPPSPNLQVRIREPKDIFEQISSTKFAGGIPSGARLRPKLKTDNDGDDVGRMETESQSWVIDEKKLFEATNNALKLHDSQSNRCHTPVLQKEKSRQEGFGVRFSFRCKFKNCKFISPLYKLFDETHDGRPLPNVQVGVAMAKTELTPNTIHVLGAALNMGTPSRQTLQKTYSQTLGCTSELAERAMADNRAVTTSALRLLGEHQDGEIPQVDVATDGQFSNRTYHFPTGKSDSVSAPVIENVTGLGLLVEHSNFSHRDGSLPANVHINSAETLAAQKNLEKSYQTKDHPLYYGTVTIDGDTSVAKALEKGRSNIGESRPLKRRACHFHGESAGTDFSRVGVVGYEYYLFYLIKHE